MPTDADLPPLIETPPGRYRHYKGGEYEVIGVARHSETHEPLVVYRPLYGSSERWWPDPADRRRLLWDTPRRLFHFGAAA